MAEIKKNVSTPKNTHWVWAYMYFWTVVLSWWEWQWDRLNHFPFNSLHVTPDYANRWQYRVRLRVLHAMNLLCQIDNIHSGTIHCYILYYYVYYVIPELSPQPLKSGAIVTLMVWMCAAVKSFLETCFYDKTYSWFQLSSFIISQNKIQITILAAKTIFKNTSCNINIMLFSSLSHSKH